MKNTLKKISWCMLLLAGVMACKPNSGTKEKATDSEQTAAESTGDNTFTNPLLPSGPDPWAIYHEGNYYYIKSTDTTHLITLYKTPDITDLRNATKKVIWQAPPEGDYSKQIWAPEIHHIDGNWYIYVAADDGVNDNHRMYVLENTTADPFEGTFEVKSRLKTDAEDNWAIDGSIFKHKDNFYFIWSGWEHPRDGKGETQNIYIAHMANPWTIDSDRVLLSTPEYSWERNFEGETWKPDKPIFVNEGPQMLKHGDKLHIVYSASGCWTPYYALGILTTTVDNDLMDKASWKKSETPIFQQSLENGVYGTGHNSFFKSPDGTEDWILYHATDNLEDGCGNKRSPRAQKIDWDAEDMPVIGVPVSTSEKLTKPSGID